ncbi:toxin 37 [Candidatus Electrothrix marina]|uniref:Toxin 37 n=1 Tax=Candidatus Electrothrix marina TaxID=1859130 RepID=A0A3S3SID4_9BACT|nr:toxin 37 [Candidatus Electrothrix marina]
MNLYSYVGGDPVNYIDPNGENPFVAGVLGIAWLLMTNPDTANAPGECDNPAASNGAAGMTVDAFLGVVGGAVTGKVIGRVASKKGLGNPFKNKTAEQIDEIFTKKGFTKSGPDPAGGTGGYVNPKTGRSYHIDPKNWGKHREPNHVDVNRPRGYKGPLNKKKLPYLED